MEEWRKVDEMMRVKFAEEEVMDCENIMGDENLPWDTLLL